MASRIGVTVEGTDGNDYTNRETIVQQYHVSAKTKSRLKWTRITNGIKTDPRNAISIQQLQTTRTTDDHKLTVLVGVSLDV